MNGACVVLTLRPNDLPDFVEGGHHITLAYLGDENLSVLDHQALVKLTSDLSIQARNLDGDVDVLESEYFGENNEAHVLTLDKSDSSVPVTIRAWLLDNLTPSLRDIFEKAETFPDYQPHLTLGYMDEGYDPDELEYIPENLALQGIGVWNGDDRLEFKVWGEGQYMEPVTEDELEHYGTPRKSGRYPWGSGQNPNQRTKDFLDRIQDMKRQGMTEAQIAQGFGISTTELRAQKSIAKNAQRQADMAMAYRLKEKGMSNVAIGERMGINESSVRSLLDPSAKDRADVLSSTADALRKQVEEKGYIDIGTGAEAYMGVSDTKLKTAVAVLEAEGYTTHYVKVEQLGTGNFTTVKVLAPPDTPYSEVFNNPEKIQSVAGIKSDDGGRTFYGMKDPLVVSADRVAVKYGDEGGSDADGVIYVRPGKDDISLGGAPYAQVRIAVEGGRYLKGMAVYKDDLPDGVDLQFNTNKKNTGNKLDAMKKMSDDPDNPFGAVVDQIGIRDGSGRISEVTSAMNLVNETGDWNDWSRNLSSQMLSKQSPALAKRQLDITYSSKKNEYDEIMALTNPAVKKKLLQSFADGADSASVHLKAAALPRQSTSVILPINSLKDTEIYAPNYKNGEKVALIRYPHGGIFEIPELTVNNRNAEGRATLADALDAVGINSKVAGRLSGADFDGDTVLVIPNNNKQVKSSPPLEGLKNFDPQAAYPKYEGMKVMRDKQKQMGDVSNLITDMTVQKASHSEIARAVRHSMVVIDAEKHQLNYKQSYIDNNIAELKRKYQAKPDGKAGGASTLISRSTSEIRVRERVDRKARDGGPIDRATGRRVYSETGASYTDSKGRKVYRTTKTTRGAEADDAFSLSSGTVMEAVYASHANRLKSLANDARKAYVNTPSVKYSPSAKKAYSHEVDTLNAKLNVALKNKPLERRAQLLANSVVSAKRQSNPNLGSDEIKKIKGQALAESRARTGAKKADIKITPTEWAAIQAGAISNSKLTSILDNTDLDLIKEYATPRSSSSMSSAILARAKTMLNAGYTQAEIAEQLGVPTSTLNDNIRKDG